MPFGDAKFTLCSCTTAKAGETHNKLLSLTHRSDLSAQALADADEPILDIRDQAVGSDMKNLALTDGWHTHEF